MTGCQVAVIGWERSAAALALYLLNWAREVTLLSHGREPELDEHAHGVLERYRVPVKRGAIRGIRAIGGHAAKVELEDAAPLGVDGIFFQMGSDPKTDLAERLGCQLNDRGELVVDRGQETTVAGVYAAGDIAAGLSHLAIHAAAEGIRAALSMHRSLLPPEWEL
jgi:thioredoxin reductase (NADPH)